MPSRSSSTSDVLSGSGADGEETDEDEATGGSRGMVMAGRAQAAAERDGGGMTL